MVISYNLFISIQVWRTIPSRAGTSLGIRDAPMLRKDETDETQCRGLELQETGLLSVRDRTYHRDTTDLKDHANEDVCFVFTLLIHVPPPYLKTVYVIFGPTNRPSRS